MIKIDYDNIEEFVSKNDNMIWEGWDVHVLKPNHGAWMKKNGTQRDGIWFEKRVVEPNSQGFWEFKEEDVNPKRTRS
jgi:hypothetical protein